MDFTKLVALNDEEEYYTWLLERQFLGIILLGVGNIFMLGGYVGGYLMNMLWGRYTIYAIYAAGGSLAVAIAADVITFIGHEDMEEWAEWAWYLQLAQIALTTLVGLFGLIVVMWNSGWALGSIFGGVGLLLNILVIAGASFGITMGIVGGIFDLATLGLYNYTFNGVEGDFDGEEIADELMLSISY